jgi:hypothetical protein
VRMFYLHQMFNSRSHPNYLAAYFTLEFMH